MGPGQTDGAESAVGCRLTQVGGQLAREGWEPSDSKSRWERCLVRSWAGPRSGRLGALTASSSAQQLPPQVTADLQ